MENTESPNPERIEEIWTYIGRRPIKGGGLGHFFLNASGQETGFKKIVGSVIGGLYLVTLDADKKTIYGSPKWTGDKSDDDLVTVWSVNHRASVTEWELRNREKKQSDEFADILAPIRAEYRKAIGSARRAAILASVIREITE